MGRAGGSGPCAFAGSGRVRVERGKGARCARTAGRIALGGSAAGRWGRGSGVRGARGCGVERACARLGQAGRSGEEVSWAAQWGLLCCGSGPSGGGGRPREGKEEEVGPGLVWRSWAKLGLGSGPAEEKRRRPGWAARGKRKLGSAGLLGWIHFFFFFLYFLFLFLTQTQAK